MTAVPVPLLDEVSLWDTLPSMAATLSADAQLLQVNRGFVKRLPSAAHALGHGWLALLTDESQQALRDALAQRADVGLLLKMQPDAGARWIDFQGRWLAARGHYVALLHDVSDVKQAEGSARARAELLRLLADNVPALIAYYDASTMRRPVPWSAIRGVRPVGRGDSSALIIETARPADYVQPWLAVLAPSRQPRLSLSDLTPEERRVIVGRVARRLERGWA